MKVAHVFNMNNDAYNIVKYMRAAGIEADLILNKHDFGMAFPQWEDAQFSDNVDPYALRARDLDSMKSLPSWIKIWDQNSLGGDSLAFLASRIGLYQLTQGYDIIEAHAPFAIYAQFLLTPYVAYDAGWVRYFPFGQNVRDKLARRGYMKAKAVLVTNPDTFYIFDRLAYIKKTVFMPFVIDCETYKPQCSTLRTAYDCDLLLFAPSRQIWHEKGNDKILIGFSQFVRSSESLKALLVMVDWGPDAERSKRLVGELGIAKSVQMIKPVQKRHLVEYYNLADVVLDQFILGSYGTAAPEAMACEKPVIMYYSEPAFLRSFRALPPLLNAFSTTEISRQLSRCMDSSFRRVVGRRSREWVAKHHSWQLVVERHRSLYSFVQGECEWEDVIGS